MRVFGVGVRNNFVLLKSGVGLAVVQQILSEAADRVEVVAVEFDGVFVGLNGVLVLLLLLVGVTERRVELGGAGNIGNRTQDLRGAGGVAEFVVQVRQGRNRFLGTGLEADSGFEFVFRFLQIVIQAVQASEKQVVVHAVGPQFHDLLVLLDGEFQNALRAVASLHIAERAEVNPAQQAAGFQVVGIALDDLLGFDHRIANPSGLGVELGEARGKVLGGWVGVDCETVFLDRFIGQLAAPVAGYLLLVHVGEGEVIVGGGSVRPLAGSGAWSARGSRGVRRVSGLLLGRK